MINEERVKELYKIALYDKNEEKTYQQVSSYFMKDYLGKEILKSFFSGSFAFIGIFAMYVMYTMDTLIAGINSIDIMTTAIRIGTAYIAFMGCYLLLTVVIYALRYSKGRKMLRDNGEHLKKLKKMYEREEKLKL